MREPDVEKPFELAAVACREKADEREDEALAKADEDEE